MRERVKKDRQCERGYIKTHAKDHLYERSHCTVKISLLAVDEHTWTRDAPRRRFASADVTGEAPLPGEKRSLAVIDRASSPDRVVGGVIVVARVRMLMNS